VFFISNSKEGTRELGQNEFKANEDKIMGMSNSKSVKEDAIINRIKIYTT